jgi:hypothetical protein
MFTSTLRREARKGRRKLGLETLENRLQPGTVLTGPGFSLLPDLDNGPFSPDDHALQMVQQRLQNGEDTIVPKDHTLLTYESSVNATATAGNPASVQPQIGNSPAVSLTSNLLALSAGAVQAKNVLAMNQQGVSVPVQLPAPVSQAVAATNAAGSPTANSMQVAPQPAAPAAIRIPSAFVHSLSARVTAHIGPDGQTDIQSSASLNWTTYVTQTTGTAAGARGVAVDGTGKVFVTGYTNDDGTTNVAFVAEYDNTGKQLALTRFQVTDPLVAYSQSEGHAVAVDNNGGVYVVGKATDVFAGDTDAFIMKFDANNQLMPVDGYGGSIGGAFDDSGEGVAVNANGEATMTGTFKPTDTETDIFAVKFSATGVDTPILRAYSNPLPGSDGSAGMAIALDSTGTKAYLAGSIHMKGGDNDIFVMQIDNTTTGNPVYKFTMTNPGDDVLTGIAVDSTGQAYVAGNFSGAGFAAQVSPDGKKLVTQYSLPNTQTATGISLDPATGNAYVVGNADGATVYVQKFDMTLTAGDFAQLAGNGMATGNAVAYDPNAGVAYVAGTTTSTDLSTDGTMLKATNGGSSGSDAFLSNVGSFS